ncbi:MAG TPA: hypothetical protein QF564_23100 [Pirellulaceae bacterium]|nr:hypothetical protein [Pirellulaceae bacterium]
MPQQLTVPQQLTIPQQWSGRPFHNSATAPHVGWSPDQPTCGGVFQGRTVVDRGFKTH